MEEKKIVRGRELFNKFHFAFGLLIRFYRIFPYRIRVKKFYRASKLTGKIGIAIRYCLAATLFKQIGKNVSIYPYCVFLHTQELSVGSNVSIHEFSYIDAYGGIEIGDDVSISHGVSVLSFEHKYDSTNVPIKNQGATIEPIKIESDVWIGAKASILGGVTISSGCIIGANGVVTKNTPHNCVLCGVPVKVIKER